MYWGRLWPPHRRSCLEDRGFLLLCRCVTMHFVWRVLDKALTRPGLAQHTEVYIAGVGQGAGLALPLSQNTARSAIIGKYAWQVLDKALVRPGRFDR